MDAWDALCLTILCSFGIHRLWRHQPKALLATTDDPLADLATRLSLPESARVDDRLVFDRDGFNVSIQVEKGFSFQLDIATADRLPGWLRIDPQLPGKPRPHEAVSTHDPFLDKAFWVQGSPRSVTALLTHPIRSQLLSMRNIVVEPGRVRSWCRASRMLHVHHWCDSVVSFVHQLADIPDPQDHALLAILKDDPNPFVRLHALRLLNEPAVDEAHRNIALQKALDDPEPKLRCFAALRMNNDDALSELQGLAGGFDITEDIRLSAFEGLLKRKSGTDLVPLLVLAASGPEGRLSRRAMGWAIAYGGDEALRDIIGKPRIPLTGLTRALDAARRRKAMIVGPSLLTILSWEAASDDRRLLAVQGLGMLGTVQAVPILKKAADDDPAMAAAARASIAEIQARCKNATVGALSLAEADDGQLAIVEDVEEGTVALAEPGHAIPHDVRR